MCGLDCVRDLVEALGFGVLAEQRAILRPKLRGQASAARGICFIAASQIFCRQIGSVMDRRIELIVVDNPAILIQQQVSQAVCLHFPIVGCEHGEAEFDRLVMRNASRGAKEEFALT